MKYLLPLPALILAAISPATAVANGVGENASWQFQTTAEMANLAYIEDLRKKRDSGFYNSPQYNTYVDTQNNFNCSNSASSSGNGGSNSAVANTPVANGATGSATGNDSAATVGGQQPEGYGAVLNNGQENLGAVFAGVTGDALTSASDNLTTQALNTVQKNFGTQDASINGSNACSFAGPTGASQ